MKFVKSKAFYYTCFWLVAILLAILSVLPYLNNYYIGGGGFGMGDDVFFHTPRILTLAEDIKHWNFPISISPYTFGGYGRADALFYPQFFLFIPSLMIALGVPAIVSFKIFIFILSLATLLICYYSGKQICKQKTIAVCFAILYTFSIYRLGDVFKRDALGEVQVLTFLPLFLYGLYNIFYEDSKKWFIIPISFFAILNSQTIGAVFSAILAFLFFVCNIKELRRKEVWLAVLKAIGTTALVSLSFVLPFVEQIKHQNIQFPLKWPSINHMRLRLTDIFNNNFGDDASKYGIGTALGMLFVASTIMFAVKFKKEDKKTRHFLLVCFSSSILLYLLASTLFNWDEGSMLYKTIGFIQFPYRMWLIILPVSTIFACYALKYLGDKWLHFVVIIMLIFTACQTLMPIKDMYKGARSGYFDVETTLKYDYTSDEYIFCYWEWMPSEFFFWLGDEYKLKPIADYGDKQLPVEMKNNKYYLNFENKGDFKIAMPITYFKGYKAYLNGKQIELGKDETGRVSVSGTLEGAGEIVVKQVPTLLQIFSKIASYSTLIYLFVLWKKKNSAIDKKSFF